LKKNLTAEQQFTDTAAVNVPAPETVTPPDKPATMLKRIGGTTYQVAVYFSKTSKETMNDKITRLIRQESISGKAANQ
jgi:hypothetical protein